MRFIDIPIGEFLERSLTASIRAGYAAFVVPIARTADGKELQDELIMSWDSLDNLTNDRILVIIPRPSGWHKKAIVPYGMGTYGVNEDLSILGSQPSTIWKNEFKNTEPDNSQESASEEKRREALTTAATETARFFSVPEQYLPCVLILSLKERHIFILPFYSSFSLYAFIKLLVVEYQPIINRIQNIKETRQALSQKEWKMTDINKKIKIAIHAYRHSKDVCDRNQLIELKEERNKMKEELYKERINRREYIQKSINELNIAELALPLSKAVCSAADQYNLEPNEMDLSLHSSLSNWQVTLLTKRRNRLEKKEGMPSINQGFTPAINTSKPSTEHVVLLVHGIRTHGHWEEMVVKILKEPDSIRVYPIRYGYLDAVKFWCPFFTREKSIERVHREIRQALLKHKNAHLSIIAHSFGTYAIGRILQEYSDIEVYRLIFCGSVLSTNFRWDKLLNQIQSGVINECGSRDIWPVLAHATSWGYGSAGRFGFGTVAVKDRFHDYKHGDYFTLSFVEKFWKPFIKDGQIIESKWDIDSNRKGTPWLMSMLDKSPLRYIILLVLFVLIYEGYMLLSLFFKWLYLLLLRHP